jgi:hypothetical protein
MEFNDELKILSLDELEEDEDYYIQFYIDDINTGGDRGDLYYTRNAGGDRGDLYYTRLTYLNDKYGGLYKYKYKIGTNIPTYNIFKNSLKVHLTITNFKLDLLFNKKTSETHSFRYNRGKYLCNIFKLKSDSEFVLK